MADIQPVRITGMLWTVSTVLGIIRDVLLIITLIAVIAGIVTIVPKMTAALGMMGGLSQAGQYGFGNSSGSGQQYGGGNYANGNGQQSGGTNNSQGPGGINMNEFALKLKGEVDSGNWDAAMGNMNTLNSMSSQLPSDVQQALPSLEQDINNRDQASFDSLFGQLMQKYGNGMQGG